MKEDFLRENATIFSRLEELNGRFLHLKSQLRSQKSLNEGLEFEIEKSQKELEKVKSENKELKRKVTDLEQKINEQVQLIPQNFTLKDNLVKIVTDIEEKKSVTNQNLGTYLDALIEEIDICINQLSK